MLPCGSSGPFSSPPHLLSDVSPEDGTSRLFLPNISTVESLASLSGAIATSSHFLGTLPSDGPYLNSDTGGALKPLRRRERTRSGGSGMPVLPFDQLPPTGPISRKQPCPCPVCGVLFFQKSDFRHHYMVHSGEKPHACDQCDFRARQLTNLKRHMKERHDPNRAALIAKLL